MSLVFSPPFNETFWGFMCAKLTTGTASADVKQLKTDDLATDNAAAATTWSFTAAGAQVQVSLLPWSNYTTTQDHPYSVGFDEEFEGTARPWLIGQVPAVHCGGQWHTPADGSLVWTDIKRVNGSVHPVFGRFDAVNVTWTLHATGSHFFTSILHLR